MTALWPGRGGPVIDYISAPPADALAAVRPRRVVLLGSTGSIGTQPQKGVGGSPRRV